MSDLVIYVILFLSKMLPGENGNKLIVIVYKRE